MDPTTPDEVLMRRFCQTLDEECFRVLAARHYAGALRLAQGRLGSEDAAQDAVQEALIRVVRYRRRYNPSKPFAQWFYTLLRNVCTDLYRKEQRHREALETFSEVRPAIRAETSALERVLDLTAGLPPTDAQMLGLRFVEGFSLGEIGSQLGCSLDATKKRFQRLLKRLRG